ncbi:hypothetical protein AC739_00720 [Planococcus glaciei]|nr:hypothetical protein G159_08305 [Planococcus glaciei CHR43]KOF12069.1 hypothetical protein AC739_00720 [Planococcus glaciei]
MVQKQKEELFSRDAKKRKAKVNEERAVKKIGRCTKKPAQQVVFCAGNGFYSPHSHPPIKKEYFFPERRSR